MSDNSIHDDVEQVEAGIVDPDEIELLDPTEKEQDHSSLLPAVAQDTSVARIDPLTAYLNEIRQYEGLTEEEERELAIQLQETSDSSAAYLSLIHI